jgi:hypothetical protein
MRSAVAVVVAVVLGALVVSCESSPTEPLAPGTPPVRAVAITAVPTQSAADDISSNVQSVHLITEFPHPTIVDPRFASSDPTDLPAYQTVVGYAHAGDAAIWTGHYLAAEAFRFAMTRSPAALANAQRALAGIQGLVDVTADAMPDNRGLLARFLWPDSWWYATRMAEEEGSHGVYAGSVSGAPHHWLGNTTRDQYSGVFFGLAVAYDAFERIDNPKVRNRAQRAIRALVTRLLDFLLRNGWNVPMPDGSFSTTFLGRPDQQLTLLQIGRHVNPERFELIYQTHRAAHMANVATPMAVECQDPHGSYFKFNLNHINLFNLIRLETDVATRATYMIAFDVLRGCTAGRQPPPPGQPNNPDHQNAHFNMIERSLQGANAKRDRETREYLGLWLERPRRDYYVDHEDTYGVCGPDRACRVIPVDKRVNTDFLWQRSPFLIRPTRRGAGTIETPAIDYLLPYWMARYYGVITE